MHRILSISAKTGRILGLCVLLALGAGSGAVVGIASASQPPVASTQAIESTQAAPAPDDDTDLVTTLTVEEPPAPAAAPQSSNSASGSGSSPARAAARTSSASSANIPLIVSVPGAALSAPAADGIQCDRLDDAKIHWLLDLSAKTRAANPGSEQAAAHVDQQLRGALGKNMCAQEAQTYVGAMCAEPGVYAYMQKMVQQLPFFVRPLVGDPCTQDLVAVANKYMR
ncbi:MAG TPA: hypothetical protein VM754_01650 [Actinomycetota bacterium]|nr:hypothetical protein [Actinomycetota bacterium]